MASFASGGQGAHGKEVDLGEGLVGQCAIEKRKLTLSAVPAALFKIATGLSEQSAADVLVLPVVFEGQVRGVIELASLERFNPSHQAFLDQLTESIGIVINTIEANTRTENLLKQSQSLAVELQQTNEELQEKARLLAHQNEEVERKNREVELARQALEEKASQLALTSKYKSEFLANMSHELRTPLNNLLILSDQLSRNPEGNLNAKQVEFAKTIHSSGNELLALIADILDLSKIESGTVAVEASELRFEDLSRYVERTFRHLAESKQVEFKVSLDPALPKTMLTDIKRLQQIIKNLLSNAFKFTHVGNVSISIAPAIEGWSSEADELERAERVIAFKVSDTGIGISAEKQQIIFEAFQQADGSTSRKYGGTGLGLAISRELSKLLGGEIKLVSAPGAGSVFTLYLPQTYVPTRTASACESRSQKPLAPPALVEAAVAVEEPSRAAVRQRGERRPRRHPARRPRDPDRRERPRLRQDPARGGAREGLQGRGRLQRRGGARHGARVPPGGDDARHLPARHAGLAGARAAQGRPLHAPHPGVRGVDRGGARPRARLGRDRLHLQAAGVARPGRPGDRAPEELRLAPGEAGAAADARRPDAQRDRRAPRRRRRADARRLVGRGGRCAC